MKRILLTIAMTAAVLTGGLIIPRVADAKPNGLGNDPHGYGKCSACACRGFSGSSKTCNNCGHYYSDHW